LQAARSDERGDRWSRRRRLLVRHCCGGGGLPPPRAHRAEVSWQLLELELSRKFDTYITSVIAA